MIAPLLALVLMAGDPWPVIPPPEDWPVLEPVVEVKYQIILYGADWCGPCKLAHPIADRLSVRGFPVSFIDIDKRKDWGSPASVPCWRVVRATYGGKKPGWQVLWEKVGVLSETEVLKAYQGWADGLGSPH